MELFSFHDPEGNFGDDLNGWIWDRLLPGWREGQPDCTLIGVGTLINTQMPRGRRKIVLGAGVGYGAGLPDAELLAECRFFSVRGPRSAQALGLPVEKGIVDPAVMLPDFPEFQGIPKSGRPIFVPHHESIPGTDWAGICARAGVDFVSPRQDARQVISRLAAAPLVIAESMHAAIIADAFGTPWQPAVFGLQFLPEKWRDWSESLGMQLAFPVMEPVSYRLRSLADTGRSRQGRGNLDRRILRRLARVAGNLLTPRRLAALARQEGQLSERNRLELARTRYRHVLAEASAALDLPQRPVAG